MLTETLKDTTGKEEPLRERERNRVTTPQKLQQRADQIHDSLVGQNPQYGTLNHFTGAAKKRSTNAARKRGLCATPIHVAQLATALESKEDGALL